MNNYIDINNNQEEGFADLTFDIITYKKKLFGNIYIECAGNDNGKTIGFGLELKKGMNGISNNDMRTWHTYPDGIKISFIKNLSEEFIESLTKSYELKHTNLKLKKETTIECGSLTKNPLDYKNKEVQFKCFLDSTNEKNIYAELYINIDLPNKKLYFKEKDISYRENIIKNLSE